jgi:hypothetical protein
MFQLPMIRLVLLVAFLTIPALAQDFAAIKEVLKREVRGTKLLRHFYANPFLHYEWTPSGLVAQDGISRFWSTDGFIQIKEVGFKGELVHIRAEGLTMIFDRKKSQAKLKSYSERRITFPAHSANDVTRAVRQIFVGPDEDLSTIVMPPWRRFVSTHNHCKFRRKRIAHGSNKA